MSLLPAPAGTTRRTLGAASTLSIALLFGCSSPSDPTEANIARGVDMALADRDPACIITVFPDKLPEALEAAHPVGDDAFPAYWIGESAGQLQSRVVARTPDRSGPGRGRITLSDLVADEALKVSYRSHAAPHEGRQAVVATAKPSEKLRGWTKTRDGNPVICHGRSKLAGVDSFTSPVDTPVGKVVQVDYRWELDEAADWVIARGAEKALRDSLPDGGTPARMTLVETNGGWQPVRRR